MFICLKKGETTRTSLNLFSFLAQGFTLTNVLLRLQPRSQVSPLCPIVVLNLFSTTKEAEKTLGTRLHRLVREREVERDWDSVR